MYRYAFLLLYLLGLKSSFSQSKRESIEPLNKRIDGLSQTVTSKDTSIDLTPQWNFFKSSITSLEYENSPLNSKSIELAGIYDDVKIYRDQWGVNHIYASNEHDMFFTQGYCAVMDRPFQFELWRRKASGTYSEIFGKRMLKEDIASRLFTYRGDLEEELSHYHPQGVEIFNSFVDGINAGIAELNAEPDSLPFEFRKLGIKPGYWRIEDVISRHNGLKENLINEIYNARTLANFGAGYFLKENYFEPNQPSLVMDSIIDPQELDLDILELYNLYHHNSPLVSNTEQTQELLLCENEGSNNWVISAERSSTSFPFLANDPHRKLQCPSLRYLVHLVSPGWNVIGAGEPQVPGVTIGHNDIGAWGITIFSTDIEDLIVYELNPENLQEYRFENKWVPMLKIEESIKVKGNKDEKVTLFYAKDGPILRVDSTNLRAYAARCAWLLKGGAPYLSMLRVNQAKDWDEFRKACDYHVSPSLSVVWADKNKDIGWQVIGKAPIRNNYSGLFPVPGNGNYKWDGYLSLHHRPSLLNPKNGYIATANENLVDTTYKFPNALGYEWAPPYRGNRIREVLDTILDGDINDMINLQSSYYSIPARELTQLLLYASFKDPKLITYKKLFETWDFELTPNSYVATIYEVWQMKLLDIVQHDMRRVIEHLALLKEIETDEFQKIVSESFASAIHWLESHLGKDIKSWRYGQNKLKNAEFTNPLVGDNDYNLLNKTKIGPLPRGGDAFTINATGSSFQQRFGASFKMISDLSDWDNSLYINTPGQAENYKSPFYKNLFRLWAEDHYIPAVYSDKAVLKFTERVLKLHPVD